MFSNILLKDLICPMILKGSGGMDCVLRTCVIVEAYFDEEMLNTDHYDQALDDLTHSWRGLRAIGRPDCIEDLSSLSA